LKTLLHYTRTYPRTNTNTHILIYIHTRPIIENATIFRVDLNKVVGCNNGGGGGNFLKVKWLVLKCIETQKRLFPEILAARVGC